MSRTMADPETMKGSAVFARRNQNAQMRREFTAATGMPMSAKEQGQRIGPDADAAMNARDAAAAPRQSRIGSIPKPDPAPSAMATAAAPSVMDTPAPATDPNSRMSAMGWSNRGVQGAEGVTRFDKAGSSPLYTNVAGDTADWVSGGMKPGVNTVPASSFSAPARGGASAQRTAAMDNQSFMSGNTLSRPGAGGSRGGGIGGNSGMSAIDQFNKAYDERRNSQRRSLPSGQVLARDRDYGSALSSVLGFQSDEMKEGGANNRAQMGEDGANYRAQISDQGQNYRAERSNANTLDNTRLSGEQSMARQQQSDAGALERTNVMADQRGDASFMGQLTRIMTSPDYASDPGARDDAMLQLLQQQRPQGYAEGGLVDSPYDSAIGYAKGGMVGGAGYGQTPQAAAVLPEVNEYREYAMGAKQLGLPAIPFEQFLTMRTGAKQTAGAEQPQGAMAFAAGGEVPDPRDVSGRMVMDTDPNAPTDSIPAIVDEQMPAKLDSGEFVFPTDAVQFFGTDKLNKMIAQARQGQ